MRVENELELTVLTVLKIVVALIVFIAVAELT
jgi:hypothetical protein